MSTFDTTRAPLTKFKTNFLRLAWLAILYLLLPVLLIVSEAINVRRDFLLMIPFVAVPVGISIYRVYQLVAYYDLEVLLYEDGFVYVNDGETRRYSWRDIDKVWTTRYELISIIYIKYFRVKILDTSGRTFTLDRILRNVDKFEAALQEGVANDKFPAAVEALEQGKKLEFGGLTITKDYVKNEHEVIRWREFGSVQTWQGTIRLWKKGTQSISIMAAIPGIPNYLLFAALIGFLSSPEHIATLSTQEMQIEAEPAVGSTTKKGMKPGGNTDARLSGLFIFVLGAGLGYWQIFLPIKQAFEGAEYISYMSEAVFLVPIAIFFGLFMLIFGSAGYGFLSKPSSKWGLVLFVIGLLVFIAGCYFGMEFIMRGLGYSFE